MSSISIYRAEFLSFPNDSFRNQQRFQGINASLTMAMDSSSKFFKTARREESAVNIPVPISHDDSRFPDLQFDRLQLPETDLPHHDRLEFGNFVARHAIIDEEFWTAAWLRAESHYEDQRHDRFVDNLKRKLAEQEFHAIKRRQRDQHGPKCRCIVTVKKEDKNVKRTVLKSVVGTLDLSIRSLMEGESFPGERVKAPVFRSFQKRGSYTYGYVANFCVAKSARRQGIARNMLYFAVESAKFDGVETVYVHVHRNNLAAQELYHKVGFEIVEAANSQLVEEKTFLLCCRV